MSKKFQITIFLLLLLAITAVLGIMKDGMACIANPLVYGVEQTEKVTNSTTTCTCSMLDEKYAPLYVTSKNMTAIDNNFILQR